MAANAPGASLRFTLSLLTGGEGSLLLEDGGGNKGKALGKENGSGGGRIKKERKQEANIASQLIGGLSLRLTSGAASIAASAGGVTLTASLSLTAGGASLPANAPGTSQTIRLRFGYSRLDAEDGTGLLLENSSGQLIVQPNLADGAASGAASAGGTTQVVSLSLTAGAAGNPNEANAPGADLTVTLGLSAGAASTPAAQTGGAFRFRRARYKPRPKPKHTEPAQPPLNEPQRLQANAPGAILVLSLSLDAGAASGRRLPDPVLIDNDLLLFAA